MYIVYTYECLSNELIYFLDQLPKSHKDCTIEVSRSHRLRHAVKWVFEWHGSWNLENNDIQKYPIRLSKNRFEGRACSKAKYQIVNVLYMIMFNTDFKYYVATNTNSFWNCSCSKKSFYRDNNILTNLGSKII